MLFAKGIASGLPLGGIVAPRGLMERWPTGAHGSTFGGNPVCCAAALATLDVLDETDGYRRTAELGERAVGHLRREVGGHGNVRDIRGIGLMVGVELADKAGDRPHLRRLPRCRRDRAVVRARRERAAARPAADDHDRRARPRPGGALRGHPHRVTRSGVCHDRMAR